MLPIFDRYLLHLFFVISVLGVLFGDSFTNLIRYFAPVILVGAFFASDRFTRIVSIIVFSFFSGSFYLFFFMEPQWTWLGHRMVYLGMFGVLMWRRHEQLEQSLTTKAAGNIDSDKALKGELVAWIAVFLGFVANFTFKSFLVFCGMRPPPGPWGCTVYLWLVIPLLMLDGFLFSVPFFRKQKAKAKKGLLISTVITAVVFAFLSIFGS